MFNSVEGMQTVALKAQELVYMLLSPGLPSNQWQIEVGGWFDTALAGLQYLVLSFINKNLDGLASWATVEFPNTNISEHRAMCDQQIMCNIGAYQSFSVLGLGIILGVGVFIIVVNLPVEGCVGWFQKRGWVIDSSSFHGISTRFCINKEWPLKDRVWEGRSGTSVMGLSQLRKKASFPF
jgi:hypothetical protein